MAGDLEDRMLDPTASYIHMTTFHSSYIGDGVNVGKISGNAWGVDDIIERQVFDKWRLLEEQGKWLADTAGST